MPARTSHRRFVVSGLVRSTNALNHPERHMSIPTVYRICIWLPIALPALIIAVAEAFGWPLAAGLVPEVLVYSLMYGGVPYAGLAAWATWWVGGRPESQIRRLLIRAPLLMVAVYVPAVLLVGLVVGKLGPFLGIALLGSGVSVLLGYAYVALTLFVRRMVGPGAV